MKNKNKLNKQKVIFQIVQAYNLRTKEWHWIIENRKYIIKTFCGYQDYGWTYLLKEPQINGLTYVALEQNLFATKKQAQLECNKRNNEN